MAGYILGTGSGVLAAAAVYYGLSSSITQTNKVLQNEIDRSSQLLDSSFDPKTPPAPSTFVGPSYPNQTRFSDTLRARWNLALTRAVDNVRETDLASVGLVVFDETRQLADKAISAISDSPSTSAAASNAASSVSEASARVGRETSQLGDRLKESGDEAGSAVRGWWRSAKGAVRDAERKADELVDTVEKGMEEQRRVDEMGAGVVGGDVRKESYTGGSETWVKAKRELERRREGRLV